MADPFAPKIGEPPSITIGAFTAWKITDDYDADLFSLKYQFLQDESEVELAGAFTDNQWTFSANSAFTGDLFPGRHFLSLIVVRLSDGEEAVVRETTITCFATASDRTSHARLMVDKIESILSNRADNDVESYTIKSRSISKMSVKELTHWREYYLAELGREADRVTGKRPNKNTLKVGFI